MKASQSISKRVDLSTFPSYDKCYELSKDEEQAFKDVYWNAILWLMDFEVSLRSLVEDAPRSGVTMIDDNGEVYINRKEILGDEDKR